MSNSWKLHIYSAFRKHVIHFANFFSLTPQMGCVLFCPPIKQKSVSVCCIDLVYCNSLDKKKIKDDIFDIFEDKIKGEIPKYLDFKNKINATDCFENFL